MRATPYAFTTRWRVHAPAAAVFAVLRRSERYPAWWDAVRSVRTVVAGDEHGIGRVDEFVWRAPLGYRLRFRLRVTTVDSPRRLGGIAEGELAGRGDWTLEQRDGVTVVRYDWRVRTTRAWMNALAPIARPVFRHSHGAVMRSGSRGLSRELGVRVDDVTRER